MESLLIHIGLVALKAVVSATGIAGLGALIRKLQLAAGVKDGRQNTPLTPHQ